MGKHAVKSEVRSPKSEIKRAVFLDRDGVINRALIREGKPYPPRSLAEFEILPDVFEACTRLKQAGFLLIVATNQPDVGRGTLPQSMVESIHALMCQRLPIDRVEVCYHSGKDEPGCDCRKPQPGMLLKAAGELQLNLSHSWMIGDRWRDIDCGHAAGCRTILVDYGYDETLRTSPDFRARNLLEATAIVVEHGGLN